VEMGARHDGDIAELVKIARPHIGILTNIGEAHLEIFGSREALARTKWGLFSMDAQAILNANDAVSSLRAASLRTPPKWFGAGAPSYPGTYLADPRTLELTDAQPAVRVDIHVHIPGKHNHENVAAAIAAARVCSMPVTDIVAAAPTLTLPPGRYERMKISGRPAIIYDAYNANMTGTLAALDAFADEPGRRRIAVLASMAELGEEAPLMHERVGSHAAASHVDVLLVGGEFADSLAKGAREAGFAADRIERFSNNTAAVTWLRRYAGNDDVVLLKGSRIYKLEEIIEGLLS
ncbi:MAG: UDP-N-acetylmuramoyl-tripeptide--D-alanyl-D-alanine ligase, partial [Candidatus Eremiobacteraeota bacterium]|nr:UDP-N-acetylmuramoyl-tripeptide--D-alanyl-D-alanine ligase [Candidatus Eremiobacteraeota bacterium]